MKILILRLKFFACFVHTEQLMTIAEKIKKGKERKFKKKKKRKKKRERKFKKKEERKRPTKKKKSIISLPFQCLCNDAQHKSFLCVL